ncbi:hypothetical protein [Streptomyces ficellus]|uniref:Uncharacterized protein n=1 Tax=Streptomyces ficellus TaxID=1977088 RepID=A0A6I6FL66_9ACTN|nr:hypothetical protein [Streptomyces ficellus]QGV82227.1 hypothetical protein EIZ62_31195 [Streptomyces ficellus]
MGLPRPLGAAELDPRRHHSTTVLAGLAVLFVLIAFDGGVVWSALLLGVVLAFAALRRRGAVRAGDRRAERARQRFEKDTKYCGGCDQILLRDRAGDGSFTFRGLPRERFRAEFTRRGAVFPEEKKESGAGS